MVRILPRGPNLTVQLCSTGTPVGADDKKVANFFVTRSLRVPGGPNLTAQFFSTGTPVGADDKKVANFFVTRSL